VITRNWNQQVTCNTSGSELAISMT